MTKNVTPRATISKGCEVFRGVDGAMYLLGGREALSAVVGQSGLAINSVAGKGDDIGCIKIRLPEAEEVSPASEPVEHHYFVSYQIDDGMPGSQSEQFTFDRPWDQNTAAEVEQELRSKHWQLGYPVRILFFAEIAPGK